MAPSNLTQTTAVDAATSLLVSTIILRRSELSCFMWSQPCPLFHSVPSFRILKAPTGLVWLFSYFCLDFTFLGWFFPCLTVSLLLPPSLPRFCQSVLGSLSHSLDLLHSLHRNAEFLSLTNNAFTGVGVVLYFCNISKWETEAGQPGLQMRIHQKKLLYFWGCCN